MLLTFAQAVNMSWRGYDLVGVAGTVFRLPDALSALVTAELTRTASSSAPALTPTITLADEAGSGVLNYEMVFNAPAAAHTLTGTVVVPAGATVIDMILHPTTQFDSGTSALLTVGDADTADGYFKAVNLKTLTADTAGRGVGSASVKQGLNSTTGTAATFGGLSTVLAQPPGAGKFYAAAGLITATLVTVGTSTVGKCRLLISILPAPQAVAIVTT